MYVVRDKETKEVIHVNRAPMSQQLEDADVYFKFDGATMEIGRSDARELPEDFTINEAGEIVEQTLEEEVEAGNQIVELTLSERFAEGLISLSPRQKIVGEGSEERIVERPLSEQVAEGLLTLLPTQKITGVGAEERIIEKTLSELLAEGMVDLEPNQKVVGETIVEKTTREMLDDGLMSLSEVKQERIEYFSDLALERRRDFLPDYKLQNSAIGIYAEQTVAKYKATVKAFREAFYRIKSKIEEAETLEDIEAVSEEFPTESSRRHPTESSG